MYINMDPFYFLYVILKELFCSHTLNENVNLVNLGLGCSWVLVVFFLTPFSICLKLCEIKKLNNFMIKYWLGIMDCLLSRSSLSSPSFLSYCTCDKFVLSHFCYCTYFPLFDKWENVLNICKIIWQSEVFILKKRMKLLLNVAAFFFYWIITFIF